MATKKSEITGKQMFMAHTIFALNGLLRNRKVKRFFKVGANGKVTISWGLIEWFDKNGVIKDEYKQ